MDLCKDWCEPVSEFEQRMIEECCRGLNSALSSLNMEPLGLNSDLVEDMPFLEVFPTFVSVKEGAPPFAFLCGYQLQVDIGPFAEVLLLNPEDGQDNLRELLVKVLTSVVEVSMGHIWTTVNLIDSGGIAWRRLKIAGTTDARKLQTREWQPFAIAP